MVSEPKAAWSKRTDYDRTDSATRTLLLDAAEQVFVNSGYPKASIARITETAGVSRATFYVYFRSREEIFLSLVESIVDAAEAAQRSERADPDDPRAVIADTIGTVLEVYAARSGLMRVVELRAGDDEHVAQLWNRLWEGQIQRGARFVERLQTQGRSDPDVEPRVAAEAMTAVLLHYGRRSFDQPEGRSQLVTELSGLYERVIALRA